MKPLLLIKNSGLAPIESFTILGLSTARGEDDKIGQFGSGSKHGILTLLRHGITPRIFIGDEEVAFTTHPAKMGEKAYEEVRYTYKGVQHKTGMCLEFGALDWDAPTMALREFICNALDQGEQINECISLVDEVRAHDGETRVFIPTDHEEIASYWEGLRNFFLHFENLQAVPIVPARANNPRFYRRGVFVRELLTDEKHPSLFTYNFQTGRIDESRNLDGAAMGQIAAKLLHKSRDSLAIIFASFTGPSKWEHTIGHSLWTFGSEDNQTMLSAWKSIYGNLPFAASPELSLLLQRKQISHVCVPGSFENCLKRMGAVDGRTLLSDLDNVGGVVVPATPTAIETFKRAWAWIERATLTNGKEFPPVNCFTMPMKGGGEKIGYCRDGTVFLNIDYDSNELAALEELVHYITGAADETRDLQDYAFKLAARLGKLNEHRP